MVNQLMMVDQLTNSIILASNYTDMIFLYNIDVFTQLYISCLMKSKEAPQSSSNS